jgi:hypothetical protein
MKSVAAITFVTLFVVFTVMEACGQTSNPAMNETPQKGKTKDPKEVYADLRNLMLLGSRSKFSLAPTSKPTEPWGVVMDWGVRNSAATVVATVVAMSDGSASVYFSSGGGYLGGKGQEPVRIAAQKAVETARAVQLPAQPTTSYPLPEGHGVFFYLLTDAGVFMLRPSEQELNSPNHPLRKMGDAMQGVITEYRLWDERRKASSSDGENTVGKPN